MGEVLFCLECVGDLLSARVVATMPLWFLGSTLILIVHHNNNNKENKEEGWF